MECNHCGNKLDGINYVTIHIDEPPSLDICFECMFEWTLPKNNCDNGTRMIEHMVYCFDDSCNCGHPNCDYINGGCNGN